MSHAVAADGTQGGVAGDDLTIAGGGGIALIGGHHIGGEEAAQTGQTAHKRGGYALAIVAGAGCSAIEAEPCTDLTDEERVEALDIDPHVVGHGVATGARVAKVTWEEDGAA